MPKNIAFCFIEGEPTLYIKDKGIYHTLYYDYDEILELVKSEILKRGFKKRPQFMVIFNILSEQFKCSEGYNPKLSKKTFLNENSFESRFTIDVTEFVDSLFKRGFSPEEKEFMKKEQQWLKDANSFPIRIFRIRKAKIEAKKRNFKI